jgi:alginate O-acetyltransferase complex protein AlgI
LLFNSLHFIFFFVLVFHLYWLLNKRNQNILLLAASYYFYGCWSVKFLSLIMLSTVVDYYCGMKIFKFKEQKQRKRYLLISLTTNLGFLAIFKYFNFFITEFNHLLSILGISSIGSSLNIILPVGISFYTFQTLSYSIDIYKGKLKPTTDLLSFSLFVSFFPQLVAGPIERASHLMPQMLRQRSFNMSQVASGFNLIIWGLMMKLLIADNLAILVNKVYSSPHDYSPAMIFLGTICFAFQIYCDFAGYSNIAIGCSRMLGFDLMKNFNQPYIATSLTEFWKRWHISLSTWFRDYLYIPLGGNKSSRIKVFRNILITFCLSGLWHGASFNFLIWGAIHGVFLCIEKMYSNFKINVYKPVKIIFIFYIVCLAWIFFRADDLSTSVYIARKYLNLFEVFNGLGGIYFYVKSEPTLLIGFTSVFFMESIHYISKRKNIHQAMFDSPKGLQFIIYLVFITILYYLRPLISEEFIYFQF